MIKKQFTLYLENKPGALASVTRKLAAEKINIEGISVSASSDVGLIQIIASNASVTRRVLKKNGVAFTAQDVVVLDMKNEPGALSRLVSRLAKSHVNISYVYATACHTASCSCRVIISAPDLEAVETAWAEVGQ